MESGVYRGRSDTVDKLLISVHQEEGEAQLFTDFFGACFHFTTLRHEDLRSAADTVLNKALDVAAH
jgi:hypothetical protein